MAQHGGRPAAATRATSQASAASQHPAGRRSSDGLVVLEVRVFHLFLCFDSHGPRDAGGPRPTGRYIDLYNVVQYKE